MKKSFIFVLILLIDFASKYWVCHELPLIQLYKGFPFGGIGILNTEWLKISLVHTTNMGAAWGILSNFQGILLFCRLTITLGIFCYLWLGNPNRIIQYALTIIAAGAIGNIIDFYIYGHVIDMFYFIFYKYSYPIFNVADAVIFCTVVFLFFYKRKIKNEHHASSG